MLKNLVYHTAYYTLVFRLKMVKFS